MICNNCLQSQKRYEKMQAELTFQIKKLTEDKAQQKLTLQMNHLKEIRRLSDKLKHQKEERQVQNRKWMEKYDSTALFYKQKIKEKEKQYQERIKERALSLTRNNQRQYKERQTKIKKEIDQIKNENEEYKKKIINVKEEQKKLISKFHQEEIGKLKLQWKLQKEQIQKSQQKLILSISEHEQQELKLKTNNIELAYEINKKNEEIDSLNVKIAQLQHCNRLCCDQLNMKEKNMLIIQREYNDKIKKAENELKNEKEKLASNMNKAVQSLFQKQLEKCQKYEDKLRDMEHKREAELTMYQKNIEQVKVIAEDKQKKCPPRFKQQINNLKGKLNNREKDFQRALKDIQSYQLQIQNKQQTFTKFLNPHLKINTSNILVPPKKKKEYSIKKSSRLTGTRDSFKQFKQGSQKKFSLTASGGDFLNHITSLQNLDRFKDRVSKVF